MDLHPFWDSFPSMKPGLKEVRAVMSGVLEESPPFIKQDLEPLFTSVGKMIRPACTILSSTAGSEPSAHLHTTTAAIELVHMAALVHDDVLDQAAERRGVRTMNSELGNKRAILGGDYLLFQALELASGAHEDGLVEEMNRAARELCLSEIEQDGGRGDLMISRETYFQRIRGKTASLFALSCKVGAHLGGADPEVSDIMKEAGENFGMAFQIEDDILDYTGAGPTMGKAAGKDLIDGIPTLPLVLAVEDGDPELLRLCASRRRGRYSGKILKMVVDSGFVEAASEIADTFRRKSLLLLEKARPAEYDTFRDVILAMKAREL